MAVTGKVEVALAERDGVNDRAILLMNLNRTDQLVEMARVNWLHRRLRSNHRSSVAA